MKITSNGIEFQDFPEFKRFVLDYELLGSVALSEPIVDKSGGILLKEKVAIKESLINKLETMDGKFIPSFKLAMSKDLMKMLKTVLAKAVLKRIEDKSNEFIKHLYEKNPEKIASLKGIIQNSFYTKSLALSFFRILLNEKEFFNHLADMGLLSLGAVIQKNYHFKMVNRYSFLAGMCADISTSREYLYRKSLLGQTLTQTTSLSLEITRKFALPDEITSAINGHPITNFEIPNATLIEINVSDLKNHPLNQELLNGTPMEDESTDEEEEATEYSEETAGVVLAALKIARFIMENLKVSVDKEQVSEKLLVMFTYNAEKGTFRKDIADPMINRFTEFDLAIKKIRVIAEIENKCKFPPAAWAYPKPKAAQVLCKDKNYQCPYIVNGWDLKIISAQDPYGYIGTTLGVGTYPKCALEEELQQKVKFD
ncbi:hypothetical protein LPTSP4_04630 [Leptospira ryugenii]|uniref:Uncharacterized protein n=1 Tax=Leptospira ryugenii TaxID=1917863 RepID=A0A2P2DWH0_9LEPT|nr:hypothetical protein [Leptospira ryugenii]GBF48957.1 hypothetical protein LPTSP4_04630 [Leptospira ryugenii]